MHELANTISAGPESTPPAPAQNGAVRLRVWPAVATVAIAAVSGYAVSLFASTNEQTVLAFGVIPGVCVLLLVVWWLAASGAPARDRCLGFLLLIGALAWVVFTQPSLVGGAMLLAYAAPALTAGATVLLAVAFRLRWPARRLLAAGFLLVCAGFFTALRVETIGGDIAPILSWRWVPTAAERSAALPEFKTGGRATLPSRVAPGDWPGFRGPARDNCVRDVRFATDWTVPPREVWRKRVGPAWSSFAVVGDYLFTQEQRGEEECVTCYGASTGEDVWASRVTARFEDTMGLGPRATPAYHDGRVYAQGCTGILSCLNASTGETLWTRDITEDAGTGVPMYGFANSPLVVGEYVIQFTSGKEGKSAIGYHCDTGEIAWMGGPDTNGYASPQLFVLEHEPQVLFSTDFGVQAFAAGSGELLWQHEWKNTSYPRCTQPLMTDGARIMIACTSGARLLRAAKTDGAWHVSEEWTSKRFRPYFNDAVFHKGYTYGFDGERLACIDMRTGERVWNGERYGGQVLLSAGMDMLLVLSEGGEIILVRAQPERFEEIARFQALRGKTWNHPVIVRDRLYVRNAEEAVCYELPVARQPA